MPLNFPDTDLEVSVGIPTMTRGSSRLPYHYNDISTNEHINFFPLISNHVGNQNHAKQLGREDGDEKDSSNLAPSARSNAATRIPRNMPCARSNSPLPVTFLTQPVISYIRLPDSYLIN